MAKANTAILKCLNDQGRKLDIPLSALRQFQEFEKTVHASMKAYDHLPPAVAFGMRSFHKIEMEHLVNLAVRYPFLNLHWLLTGKGKMFH